MVKVALFVRLEAKRGKEADLEKLLCTGLTLALEERTTHVWLAVRMGPSTFGIFDAFPDEDGRQEHLADQLVHQLAATPVRQQHPRIILNRARANRGKIQRSLHGAIG